MSKVNRLSLKTNFSWNFLGSIVYSASQFFILILLAKLGNPEMVGLYSLGLALTAPIVMFTNLQLRQIQATDTSNYYRFNHYYALRIISSFFAIGITILIIIFGDYNLNKSIVILLVALSKVIDSFSDVSYGQLQQRERMDYIGISRVIKGIFTVIIMGICLFLTKNLFVSLIMLNITWIIIFLAYDQRKLRLFIQDRSPTFDLAIIKKLIVLALPLGIVLMLISLNSNLPRIFVDKLLGEEALGYFASISYLLVVGNAFIQSVGQAAAPRLARTFKDGEYKKFKKMLYTLLIIALTIGLFGTLISTIFGELVLTIIYDNTYAEYNYVLILVMIASIFSFSSSFLGYGITAMRLFKIQPIIGSICLLITIISSFIFITNYGIKGAAYTLIIGSITEFITKVIVIKFNIK